MQLFHQNIYFYFHIYLYVEIYLRHYQKVFKPSLRLISLKQSKVAKLLTFYDPIGKLTFIYTFIYTYTLFMPSWKIIHNYMKNINHCFFQQCDLERLAFITYKISILE